MRSKKLKYLLSFGLSILLYSHAFAQSFEGKLTYQVDFEVLSNLTKMGVTKDMLIDKMKKEGSWYNIQEVSYGAEGSYYIQLGADKDAWLIYRPDSNKIYTFHSGSSLCAVTDASIDAELQLGKQKPLTNLLDTSIVWNGKNCNVVRVKWTTGYYDYAFCKGFLTINPEIYKNHIYDGWYEYLKIAKSLPVQIVKVTNGMMKITSTLENYKEMEISSSLFSIPPLKLAESTQLIKIPGRQIMSIAD